MLEEVFPFKLKCYKKEFISEEVRRAVILAYPCIKADILEYAGSYYEDNMVLLKKYPDGKIQLGKEMLEDDSISMNIQKFVSDFKTSEALDFVILNLELNILITRGDKGFNIYMTNYIPCLKMFAEPSGFFWNGKTKQLYFKKQFETSFLGTRVNKENLINNGSSAHKNLSEVKGGLKSTSEILDGEAKATTNLSNQSVVKDGSIKESLDIEVAGTDESSKDKLSNSVDVNEAISESLDKEVCNDLENLKDGLNTNFTAENEISEATDNSVRKESDLLAEGVKEMNLNNTSDEIIQGRTENDEVSEEEIENTGPEKEVHLRTVNPISEEEFYEISKKHPNSIYFNLGKIKKGENESFVEFSKHSSFKGSYDLIKGVIDKFPNSYYDFIEIVGATKITGFNKNGSTLWFTERKNVTHDEAEYITVMAEMLKIEETDF